jgi:hypothetical protein
VYEQPQIVQFIFTVYEEPQIVQFIFTVYEQPQIVSQKGTALSFTDLESLETEIQPSVATLQKTHCVFMANSGRFK